MADSYSITLIAEILQANIGDIVLTPAVQSGTTPHYSSREIELANGDNTIAVPTSVFWAIIVFSPTSPSTKKLKGVGGDTGITCSTNGILLLSVVGGSNFVINSSVSDAGFPTRIIFI